MKKTNYCSVCGKENLSKGEIEKTNAIGSGADGNGHLFWHKENFCTKGNSGAVKTNYFANEIKWAKDN